MFANAISLARLLAMAQIVVEADCHRIGRDPDLIRERQTRSLRG
jgi:hypothetical protein